MQENELQLGGWFWNKKHTGNTSAWNGTYSIIKINDMMLQLRWHSGSSKQAPTTPSRIVHADSMIADPPPDPHPC